MKIALIILVALPLLSIAQISINNSDMPSEGDTIRTSSTINIGFIDFEETGPDYTWDFTSLIPFTQSVDSFVAVSETPLFYQLLFFFTANLAQQEFEFDQFPGFEITDSYRFYKNSSASFKEVGFGVSLNGIPLPTLYDDADVIYKFPVEYENVDSSYSSYDFSIPGLGYYGGWKKRKNEVDGWGEVSTPYGTFEALRMKTYVYQYDSLYIDSLGFGLPIYRELTEYRWLSEDQGLPILQVTDNGILQTAAYIDSVRTILAVAAEDISEQKLHVYPNPVSSSINVQTNLPVGKDYHVELFNLQGQRVFVQNGIITDPTLTIHLKGKNITSGNYTMKLISGNEVYVSKIIVQRP